MAQLYKSCLPANPLEITSDTYFELVGYVLSLYVRGQLLDQWTADSQLYEDDGTTPLYEDDGTTPLTMG